MERLVAHVVGNCPELSHVKLEHMLVCVSRCRHGGRRGVHARLVPLRFQEGATTRHLGERVYRIPEFTYQGREILYLVYFYLPRFLESPQVEDKLATVFHELYHVHPECNGDLRRFPGRAYAHGPSRRRYHERARAMARRYLAAADGDRPWWFLDYDFTTLESRVGPIIGRHVGLPHVHCVTATGRP